MKMWDGRFAKSTDRLMDAFNNSLPIDQALITEDIAGSIAWGRALARCGVLTRTECTKIERGLRKIAADHAAGKTIFLPTDEDIHMAVERLLTTQIGAAGAKLHTGRSRNDQVTTDVRLYVKKALDEIEKALAGLQKALIARAEKEMKVIIPAYTHLQQAQPVSLAHYWLSFVFLLEREKGRVAHARATTDQMPLGSGAVAGSGFPVDRQRLAEELGFAAPTSNSIDGVASRDFLLETLSAISSIGISLSRYAEDLIIWSSREFSFIELDDAWATGSSMMPQKKNPDPLELIRGKSGRFMGNYTRLAATLKGVGLAYCKDLQEDKEPLFDSVTQILQTIAVFTGVVRTLSVNQDEIKEKLDPLLLATDLADYLVTKGMPFRQAHAVVGKMVAYCVKEEYSIGQLSISEFRSFSPLFADDLYTVLSWNQALAHRDIAGGTGPKSVRRQLAKARRLVR